MSTTAPDSHQPDLLKQALNGDINAFHTLFAEFKRELRSYLYRLLADRNEAEDLTHDAFVKGYEKRSSFQGNSSLKTWVFRIATNLAYDYLRRRQRWSPDAQDKSKALAMGSREIVQAFQKVHQLSPAGSYDIKEHIDFCFTCIGKTLPIEQQVALILKDIYEFSRKEIANILDKTEGVVKHLLFNGRKTMITIFDQRCALISKNGVCHQCTELAGIYNPKQAKQEELMKIKMVAKANEGKLGSEGNQDHESSQGNQANQVSQGNQAKLSHQTQLYQLRKKLVQGIDPLGSPGADLQDVIMQCTRMAIGEVQSLGN